MRRTLKFCLPIFWAAWPLGAQTTPTQTSPTQPGPIQAGAVASNPAPDSGDERKPGSISGIIRSDLTGQPLRRAQVVLNPEEAGAGSLVQTTDETGRFSFPKVTPGSYSITVLRDGYLQQSAGRIGAYKMPPLFLVQPGQDIGSFTFRMAPWGVIGGRVKFDDAEPAVNVVVQLYREYYRRGRHGWAAAASTRTNDRGEYRVHGLEPGAYYVAALYQPPQLPPDATEQRRTDSAGKPQRELSYAVTFYPDTQRLADAVAVRISSGQEVDGIDVFLTLVHTVRIRGRVLSALSGAPIEGPNISLRWNDAENTGSISAPVDVKFDRQRNFVITGVTPGPYIAVVTGADGGLALSSRTPISVGDADVDELTIVVGPQQKWKGRIVVDGDESTALGGLVVELEPRRATAFPTRGMVDKSGKFELPFLPRETYDVNVLNMPEDAYIEAVHVGKTDRLATGVEAEPGDATNEMEVVLSTRGGKLLGRAVTATDSSIVAAGARVMLIPDPPYGRSQAYRSTFADQYGNFLIRGIAPGAYIAVAWFDQPPCEIDNPDDLAACSVHGVRVIVSDEALESIQLAAY